MPISVKLFKQLGIILALALAGEGISRLSGLPVPGSIMGMLLLLILLKTKVLRVEQVSEVTDFLLAHINFFFIPVGVGIMVSYKYLEGHYLAGITLILVTTVVVMAVSGGVTEILARRREKRVAARAARAAEKDTPSSQSEK